MKRGYASWVVCCLVVSAWIGCDSGGGGGGLVQYMVEGQVGNVADATVDVWAVGDNGAPREDSARRRRTRTAASRSRLTN